jgi:NAD(P)-dependent dehydrogenase (short-subunit alcohol dehydrogenase family)
MLSGGTLNSNFELFLGKNKRNMSFRMPPSVAKRMAYAVVAQRYYNIACPAVDLAGQLFVVTGGAAGIGLGVSKGLVSRGATVVMCGRNAQAGQAAVAELNATRADASTFLVLDLADLAAVSTFVRALAAFVGKRKITGLIANAGVWPEKSEKSAQGFEAAFATNVLGHHLLFHAMQDANLFVDSARIVITTGDIYIMSSGDPAEDFVAAPGKEPEYYYRSKLANLWQTAELQEQFPQHVFVAVHPGVIATNLVAGSSFVAWIKSLLLLTIDEGAQAQLFAATQPMARGAYLHNTCGVCELDAADPAMDKEKGKALIAKCDRLIAPFRKK